MLFILCIFGVQKLVTPNGIIGRVLRVDELGVAVKIVFNPEDLDMPIAIGKVDVFACHVETTTTTFTTTESTPTEPTTTTESTTMTTTMSTTTGKA